MVNKLDPDPINSLINELLDGLSLEDRVNIANLSEGDIHVLESVMGKYLKHRLDQLSETGEDVEEANAILKEIWKRLRATHRLRVVR